MHFHLHLCEKWLLFFVVCISLTGGRSYLIVSIFIFLIVIGAKHLYIPPWLLICVLREKTNKTLMWLPSEKLVQINIHQYCSYSEVTSSYFKTIPFCFPPGKHMSNSLSIFLLFKQAPRDPVVQTILRITGLKEKRIQT